MLVYMYQFISLIILVFSKLLRGQENRDSQECGSNDWPDQGHGRWNKTTSLILDKVHGITRCSHGKTTKVGSCFLQETYMGTLLGNILEIGESHHSQMRVDTHFLTPHRREDGSN